MTKLLNKEFRLCASPLSWIFLAAAGMTLLPGYPILMGAFFICLGIFQSFQNGREANDVLYTVLLPVQKAELITRASLTKDTAPEEQLSSLRLLQTIRTEPQLT